MQIELSALFFFCFSSTFCKYLTFSTCHQEGFRPGFESLSDTTWSLAIISLCYSRLPGPSTVQREDWLLCQLLGTFAASWTKPLPAPRVARQTTLQQQDSQVRCPSYVNFFTALFNFLVFLHCLIPNIFYRLCLDFEQLERILLRKAPPKAITNFIFIVVFYVGYAQAC